MWLDANQHAGEQFAKEECRAYAEDSADGDEARGLRDDEAEQSAAGCAEREADAHLLGALRDRVGEDAVDADGGEDDGERSEAGDEQHDEAALGYQARDALIHGLDVEERLLRVYGEDCFAHGVGEERGVGSAAKGDVDLV